ncbi:shikimate dehydrogenase [Cellulomonas sp. zg-ZUI222]|uniref:Shikimate dehydrogenase n=1 Tax=Cellulomonas wangleii TaxID=2816956 RepID=A0ABX8DBG7_9CELL|nr:MULTISPECIES: shikimate dehydrogenase [Cellulomonas]MBO0900379.1 shikimate dehydrogenase [Cellulomonas sp. zg-ZUI22]MBO0922791.1 shikimate dehydrogenase [Cellulomonas wangleii]MBO0926344.1 shikimate dehydrogenase [Cellulomonas wangleii]QVI63971.1 shikimate dehydrogenase [Cellulomonas wangleii]
MTSAARRAAVLGHPVAHSLSPVLHRAAYTALGLDGWRYDAVDVTQDALPALLADLDDSWAGLSLTMPLKQTVIALLDHVEPLAEVVGAVNTVLPQGSGAGRMLTGANTDVHGIVAALGEAGVTGGVATAAVVGAGATASSTLAALAQLGCPTPRVYVRSQARAGALLRAAHRMGVEPRLCRLDDAAGEVGRCDVVVSTLPAHAADPLAAALPASVGGALLDVCYDPRPTALSAAWAARGGRVVGGERMLLHQAAEQVRLMTGRTAPVAAMDVALSGALAPVG